jgi:hypothetical protein
MNIRSAVLKLFHAYGQTDRQKGAIVNSSMDTMKAKYKNERDKAGYCITSIFLSFLLNYNNVRW